MSDPDATIAPAPAPVLLFDGTSSRRHPVSVAVSDRLEIRKGYELIAAWPYPDIRRADGPAGVLRLACVSAPPLARLEVRDPDIAQRLIAHCPALDRDAAGRHGIGAIVGWSLAAIVSLVLVSVFGMPLIADRLAPLLPPSLERRIGDVADRQIRALFGDTECDSAAGQAAFAALVDRLRDAAGIEGAVAPTVLSSPIPNALALPGGRVYLLSALLDKAESADEIAGVLAHEMGHVTHRDNLRRLIRDGGSSFLIGLLFGDISGSGALVFVSKTLVTSQHSRETETDADTFSIDTMHRLGRPVKPMGELLFRVTGKQGGSSIGILASHPLTEDRLARMAAENRSPTGAPLLSDEQWRALKAICVSTH
jgi:Zn-dependent protease with chaperone function